MFRRKSQCTFWCSVLSDIQYIIPHNQGYESSQCTFWCSVLSDWTKTAATSGRTRLNAPFGAQCFPTEAQGTIRAPIWSQCTFWCSVLSDRRAVRRPPRALRVSMHLLVLSAFRPIESLRQMPRQTVSQCTFWCSVLSDWLCSAGAREELCLNAPFGAQCFPTPGRGCSYQPKTCLNAPFGAQCFPTRAACLSWRRCL